MLIRQIQPKSRILYCALVRTQTLAMANHKRKASSEARSKHNKSRNLRVLIDMDGVLCDFESQVIKTFTEKYPTEPHVPLHQRRSFYLNDDYRKIVKESRRKLQSVIYAKGFFEDIVPIEGAIESLKEMSSMERVDVCICTSPVTQSQYCVQEKFNWIANYFGSDWLDKMIITTDKTVVKGDLLIDDKPYIKGAEHPRLWDQILFSCCHNEHLNIDKLDAKFRLASWTDGMWKEIIEEYLRRISK